MLLWKCHQANESRQAEPSCKSLLISSGFSIYLVAPVFSATANREKWAGHWSIFTVQLAKKGHWSFWFSVKEKDLSSSASKFETTEKKNLLKIKTTQKLVSQMVKTTQNTLKGSVWTLDPLQLAGNPPWLQKNIKGNPAHCLHLFIFPS